MGKEETVLSEFVLVTNYDSASNVQTSSMSIDSFVDDFSKNSLNCTHTHTCNPPGPDAQHAHTCYHTRTQILPFGDDQHNTENDKQQDSTLKQPKQPSGNREAVRKYREKKKAHTAYLEEQVKKLRVLNQQLIKKLQGQSVLEAEVLRLRGLLHDLRGKIDGELSSSFPFPKQRNTSIAFKEGNCETVAIGCENNLPCFHSVGGGNG